MSYWKTLDQNNMIYTFFLRNFLLHERWSSWWVKLKSLRHRRGDSMFNGYFPRRKALVLDDWSCPMRVESPLYNQPIAVSSHLGEMRIQPWKGWENLLEKMRDCRCLMRFWFAGSSVVPTPSPSFHPTFHLKDRQYLLHGWSFPLQFVSLVLCPEYHPSHHYFPLAVLTKQSLEPCHFSHWPHPFPRLVCGSLGLTPVALAASWFVYSSGSWFHYPCDQGSVRQS